MRYRSDPARIRGSIAALVTPFTDDGAVDHDSLRTLVRWQVDSGSHGVSIGGAGFISALANIAPAAVAQMYEAAVGGDPVRARELHYGAHPLVDLLFVETNPTPAKWLMHERGLIPSDHVRPPLIPLSEPGRQRVHALAAAGERYLTPVDVSTPSR